MPSLKIAAMFHNLLVICMCAVFMKEFGFEFKMGLKIALATIYVTTFLLVVNGYAAFEFPNDMVAITQASVTLKAALDALN